jgi:hypothetical protein
MSRVWWLMRELYAISRPLRVLDRFSRLCRGGRNSDGRDHGSEAALKARRAAGVAAASESLSGVAITSFSGRRWMDWGSQIG